ncbi:hypothetical protein Q4Q34_04160 [Flavivirga abyssicola]|uniref:hypothetical protein n=1 Tax=Flavivirga abyssicola TaxID=3063533 RepID=UPI0026E03E0D|nr:hypothetical protein [Flavivirga sp. MEBiC07777]WVK14221.1 hypothetical protein Q4Q34_04160 [Flavivirga sp. MEBiC07777]
MKYKLINLNSNRVIAVLITVFLVSAGHAQNVDAQDFPEEIQTDISSLSLLRKSKKYIDLIEAAITYKKDNLVFSQVYDAYIVEAYFQLENFDKVIEYVKPYIDKESYLFAEGTAEIYLGQAYINLNKKAEGCNVLKTIESNDAQFKIMYMSNCFEAKEYVFNIAGNKQNTSTNLKLNKGDVVGFKANGKVSYGMFTGYSGPEGFLNGAYRTYNRTQEMNHGELFYTTSNDPYLFYDLDNLSLIKSSGNVVFHINDKEVRNNSGSFKATLKVYSETN